MRVKCPYCNSIFRAYILKGHMIIETKHKGYSEAAHSELCACLKKKQKKEVVTNGRGA